MAVIRSQFYQSGVALLVWLQKIEKCVTTKYDINLPEMNYLASSLSSQECYNFYNLLSHRPALRGQISVYAEKEKAQEISCISLLATWLTDPEESKFRSNENVELKLREIGRKDLARWLLGKIDSTLKRRQLDFREINRQIEESEINDAIVRNRIGERIIPIASIKDVAFMKNENLPEDRQTSCVFWKVFFSCLIILLLVSLFFYFYRFVYAKLRCICRRFNDAEDQEHCLPEQTYGTTSCSDFKTKNLRTKKSDNLNFKDNNDARVNKARKNLELSENFSSATERDDKIFTSIIEEKRALLVNHANKLTKNWPTIEEELSTNSKKNESIEFSIEPEKSTKESKKSFFSLARNTQITTGSLIILKNNVVARNKFVTQHKNIENTLKLRKWKSMTREIIEGAKKIDRSRSENCLSLTRQKNEKKVEKQKCPKYGEMRNLKNSQSLKWTSCSCNLIEKLPRTISLALNDEEMVEKSKITKNLEKTITSSCESLTELSETYDELGMLFSQYLKRQSRPCRRKYCSITRKLRRGTIFHHDVKKCCNRRKTNFGEKIIINWDRRPACSSGNICKETYDEYEIMRATRVEREGLARSIIERRKYFLDQPCLSPIATKSCDELTNCDEN